VSDVADKIANRVLQAEVRAALESLESQNQALQEALKEADRNIAAIRKAADDPAFSHEFVGKVTRSVLAGPPTETQQQILARLSLTVEADSE
jgi:hypothetical protein